MGKRERERERERERNRGEIYLIINQYRINTIKWSHRKPGFGGGVIGRGAWCNQYSTRLCKQEAQYNTYTVFPQTKKIIIANLENITVTYVSHSNILQIYTIFFFSVYNLLLLSERIRSLRRSMLCVGRLQVRNINNKSAAGMRNTSLQINSAAHRRKSSRSFSSSCE